MSILIQTKQIIVPAKSQGNSSFEALISSVEPRLSRRRSEKLFGKHE